MFKKQIQTSKKSRAKIDEKKASIFQRTNDRLEQALGSQNGKGLRGGQRGKRVVGVKKSLCQGEREVATGRGSGKAA